MKILISALLILSSVVAFGQEGEKNFIDQNYIEVTGTAELRIDPDLFYLAITIKEKDFKGKKLADVEQEMISKLQEIGINTKSDLVIKDLASNFRDSWIKKDEVVLSKDYLLTIKEPKLVGEAFLALQKIGISNVGIEKVENSKIADYRRQAKINAIKVAQDKAKELTSAIDQTIGKALFIKEVEDSRLIFQNSNVVGHGSFDSSIIRDKSDQPYEKILVRYSIMVRFELK